MKAIILNIILIISFFSVFAQNQIDTTRYTPYDNDYKFIEGIYISIEQVKLNKPLTIERIITDVNPDDFDFFDKLLQTDKIYFFDDFGVKKEIYTKKIWGYCRSGSLYINFNNQFNRIPVVGNISHFIADQTVLHERYTDPFYYNPYYYPMNTTYQTKEMRQYVLDFETGNILNYNWKEVQTIFMRDSKLFDEFNQLKKRKRKKLLFLYIRKYNEHNPLYLPK